MLKVDRQAIFNPLLFGYLILVTAGECDRALVHYCPDLLPATARFTRRFAVAISHPRDGAGYQDRSCPDHRSAQSGRAANIDDRTRQSAPSPTSDRIPTYRPSFPRNFLQSQHLADPVCRQDLAVRTRRSPPDQLRDRTRPPQRMYRSLFRANPRLTKKRKPV